MATKNIKCLARFASIAVLIAVVQASHTSKVTLTKTFNKVSNNSDSSGVPTSTSKRIKIPDAHKHVHHHSLNKSAVSTTRPNRNPKKTDAHKNIQHAINFKTTKDSKAKSSGVHIIIKPPRTPKYSKKNRKPDSHQNLKPLKTAKRAHKTSTNNKYSKKTHSNKQSKLPLRHEIEAKSKHTRNDKPFKNTLGLKNVKQKGKRVKRTNLKVPKQAKKGGKNFTANKKKLRQLGDDDFSNLPNERLEVETALYNGKGTCSTSKQIGMNVNKFFGVMHSLNTKNLKTIQHFVKDIGGAAFNKEMYEVMLSNRSVAERALTNAHGVSKAVPAGLQLGGYGSLKQDDSLMFFHRLKLRNDTEFVLFPIENDMRNMVLHAHLSLGDLHLEGNYERLMILNHPPSLYYVPTYGSVEFLLSKVEYKMEGRYRVANGRLRVEQVVSNISAKNAFMNYRELKGQGPRSADKPTLVTIDALEDFVDRVKIDLNQWVKDYFNDYLIYFGLARKHITEKFQSYDKQKTLVLNDFVDYVVRLIRWRIDFFRHLWEDFKIKLSNLFILPDFKIKTSARMTLHLTNGRIHGLNSIYRRSIATGPSFADHQLLRQVEAVVGFSDLRVVYKYEATVSLESPPIQGQLILTAKDLTAHMGLMLFKDESIEGVTFDQIQPMKVQTLTIEGPVNRLIGSYRHVLENHITALLTNVLMNQVKEISPVFVCTDHEEKAEEPMPVMKGLFPSEVDINHLDDPEAAADDRDDHEEQDGGDRDDYEQLGADDNYDHDAMADDREDHDDENADSNNDSEAPSDYNNEHEAPAESSTDDRNDHEQLDADDNNYHEAPADDRDEHEQTDEDDNNDHEAPADDRDDLGALDADDNNKLKKLAYTNKHLTHDIRYSDEDNVPKIWPVASNGKVHWTYDIHSSNEDKFPDPIDKEPVGTPDNGPQRLVHEMPKADLGLSSSSDSVKLTLPKNADEPGDLYVRKGKNNKKRRFVGRQKINKKGGKDSRSVLVINGRKVHKTQNVK